MWESQSSANEILPRSYLQTLGDSSYHHLHQAPRKRIPIFLTSMTEPSSLAKRRSQCYCISSRWCDEIPRQTKAQLNNKMKLENVIVSHRISPRVETKESYSYRIKKKRLCRFYSNSFVSATAYFVSFYLRLLIFCCWLNRAKKIYFFINCV